MREGNPDIYRDYIKKCLLDNYTNSFFILNKIYLMDNEEKEKKDFENYMLENHLKINLKDKTIHIEYLSCQNLTKETEKFENFQSYLKYLLIKGGNNKTNLFLYMQEKMEEDFKLDLNKVENNIPNEDQMEDILQKIQELEDENSSFTTLIDPEDYFNYSNIFDELNKLLRKREEENYMKKSKKYKDLYDNFNKSFRNSFLNFISIPNNKEVIERIKNIEKNISKIMKEDKETMQKQRNTSIYYIIMSQIII